MKALAIILALAGTAQASWPTNYQHFSDIRYFAKNTPKWTEVCITLNSGEKVFGQLLKYEPFNDHIWYQPQGTGHNWFKQDAFDVHEISAIEIVEPI